MGVADWHEMSMGMSCVKVAVLLCGMALCVRASGNDAGQWEEILTQTGCSRSLKGDLPSSAGYVCDTTVGWLHYDGSSWAAATPPTGTGCHHYVAFAGKKPSGCSVGSRCKKCKNPGGKRLKTVKLAGGSCNSC